MKLNKRDLGIKITDEGVTEIYLPKLQEFSGKNIRLVLKEIRRLEIMFTELANETYEVEGEPQ